MNQLLERKNIPWIFFGLGVAGGILQTGLYAAAVDEKGLLLRGHPLEWGLWLLAALAAVLAAVSAQKEDKAGNYTRSFAPSRLAALWTALFALGTGLDACLTGVGQTRLELAGAVMGLAATAALLWAAVLRLKGRKPSFLLYCGVCVYLSLYMVNHYRLWSGDPQLLDYVFSLMAVVFLTLYAYQQAACCLGMAKLPVLMVTGLLTVFFGFASGELLFTCGAFWCMYDLTVLEPVPVPREPEEPAEEESL